MAERSHDDIETYQMKKYQRHSSRKIYPGPIDVHPTELAIIVHYTAQASILGEDGQPVAGDKKACQKVIRLKSLNPQTNIANLASEVIEKCKIIAPTRYDEVEQLLYYLQKRETSNRPNTSDMSNRTWLKKQLNDIKNEKEDDSHDGDDLTAQREPVASMSQIETYIEGLYEEVKEKIMSTRLILQLAKVPENMPALVANESLMSALSRVLREDGRRSIELVTNIIYIFFCFSNFSEFHSVITANKIGDLCLRVTDQELARFNLLVEDIKKIEKKAQSTPNDKSLNAKLAQEHQKFQNVIRKQDQLLFVSFHLLLNLAEDLNIEVKMIKRDIVKYLINMLERSTPELLVLSVTFLKKLSVFKENKDQMVKYSDHLLEKLDSFICSDVQNLQALSLRLALNLSHDNEFRLLFVKHHIANDIVPVLTKKNNMMITLQLLYQLSINRENRSASLFEEILPNIIRLILEYKGDRVNKETMALIINLATEPKITQLICQNNGLKFILKRAIKTQDSLMFKLLRNLSQHDETNTKIGFLENIDDLMNLLLKSQNEPSLMVEILSIIANLSFPDFDYLKLVENYGLINFLAEWIFQILNSSNGNSKSDGLAENDDILLQCVIFLGVIAVDENIPPIIAKSQLLALLVETLMVKEEDDEIVLQACYCIYLYLHHESTCLKLIALPHLVDYLIDLLYDRNLEIRKICDAALGIIAEIDDEWDNRLRRQKFAWHNSEWIKVITQQDTELIEETDITIRSNAARMNAEKERLISTPYSDSEDEDDHFKPGIGGSSALLYSPQD